MSKEELKPVESGFGKKAFNRILKYLRRTQILPGRPGWSFTPNGILPPPAQVGGAGGDSFPWQISVVDAETPTLTISEGTILKSNDNLSDVLTRNSPSEEFTVSAGGFIAIKITGHQPTTYDVEYSSSWSIDGDDACNITTIDADLGIYQFESRLLPVWAFLNEDDKTDTDVAIGNDVWARRCLQNHLVIEDGFYLLENGSRITVPILKPSVRAIP